MRLVRGGLTTESFVIGLMITILLFLMTACGNSGGGGSEGEGAGAGTGSIAFSLKIQDDPVTKDALAAAQLPGGGIDCEFHQIEEIEAYINNAAGSEIARGGPWPCDQHSGVIEPVPTDEYLTLQLYANQMCTGELIFHGEKGSQADPIIVQPGEVKDVGQVELEQISNPWQLTTIEPDNQIACINGYYNANLATSIAISPKDDSVHIGYYDCDSPDIKYATNASGTWEIEILPKEQYEFPLGHTSIAVDSDGIPHISYIGDSCGDGCYALYHASKEAGSWITEIAYDEFSYREGPRNTSIAVRSDSTGKVVDMTCIGNLGEGLYILYVSCSNNVCQSEELGPGEYEYVSLAHDSNQFAHIGYSEFQGGALSINYRTNNPAQQWQVPETLDTYNTEVGAAPAIALDSNDTVHISYCDQMNSILKYLSGTSSNWSASETVESGVNGCEHTSITVDSLGIVHISYNADGELKYATGVSECWIIHSVDNSGIVGLYNSIAVDSKDNVHISYYDSENGVLKYATRAIQR